jgi:para-aminobenzoate synthetase component I
MTTSNEPYSSRSFPVNDPEVFKTKMLNWIKKFNIFCLLDNHNYSFQPHRYEWLAGAGADEFISSDRDAFSSIDAMTSRGNWTFGHIAYEQGAAWLGMDPQKRDPVGFPLFYFFRPVHVLLFKGGVLTIHSSDAEIVYQQILATEISFQSNQPVELQQRLTRKEYLEKIRLLKAHIQRGDCYEINFCQEFFGEQASIDPASLYRDLCQASPNPFNGFYRVNDSYLLCASPERFLYRSGQDIYSQPMKGTSGRSAEPGEDERSKKDLLESEKDRSENVMVVDLVRNDLSRFCEDGSVKVEELFGIYSFPRVHQLVSTVKGRIQPNVYLSHIIRSAFPMGSMTGAPKIRVVELIDQYEPTSRGIFSGSIGYINPSGDFDFNVVIRSIMYNEAAGYLSYQVGSGITFYSEAEKEWEECLLKGEAIKKVLTKGQHL